MTRPAPPAVNRERGEVPLWLRDRWIVLRMDYDAFARVVQVLGDDGIAKIGEASRRYDLATICDAIAVLAQRHQPGITREEVWEASPPYQDAMRVLLECWKAFNWGTGEPAESESEADEHPLAGWRRFAALFGMRRGSGSAPTSSGASPRTSSA